MPTEPAIITANTPEEALPDDIHALKQMVLTLLAQIDDLNGQLYYLKRQLFGKKSEKCLASSIIPDQRQVFLPFHDKGFSGGAPHGGQVVDITSPVPFSVSPVRHGSWER